MSLPLVFLPLKGHLSHVCHCPTKSSTHCIYYISSISTPLVSNTPFMLPLCISPSSISPPSVCHNPHNVYQIISSHPSISTPVFYLTPISMSFQSSMYSPSVLYNPSMSLCLHIAQPVC